MNKTLIIGLVCASSVYGIQGAQTQHGVTYTHATSSNQESDTYSKGDIKGKDGITIETHTIFYDQAHKNVVREDYESKWEQILPARGGGPELHNTVSGTASIYYEKNKKGETKTRYSASIPSNPTANPESTFNTYQSNFKKIKDTFDGK